MRGQPCSGTDSIHKQSRQPPAQGLGGGKRDVACRVCRRAGKAGTEEQRVSAKVLRPGLQGSWGRAEAREGGWTVSGLRGHFEGTGFDGTGLDS